MLIQRLVVRLHLHENADPDGLFESEAWLIFVIVAVHIYIGLQTVQRFALYSAVNGTMHYGEPLTSFNKSRPQPLLGLFYEILP